MDEEDAVHTDNRILHACVHSCSVVPNSSVTHGLQPTRLLCPWNFLGKNTGVGCHFLLQGIFPTQGSNQRLLHLLLWRADSLPLRHLGSLYSRVWIPKYHGHFCKKYWITYPTQYQGRILLYYPLNVWRRVSNHCQIMSRDLAFKYKNKKN